MSDPKDSPSFFRKMVKFVANPATDWADLTSRTEDVRETEFAKSELKAMVERKRRNDFVRKREFDMLRKVRREGLTSEQLASLGGSSRLDDSEGRMPESLAKAERGVKAKIDEIEQQMVGDHYAPGAVRRPPGHYDATTQPAGLAAGAIRTTVPGALSSARTPFSSALSPEALSAKLFPEAGAQPTAPADFDDAPGHGPAAADAAQSAIAASAVSKPTPSTNFSFNIGNDVGNPFDLEVSEVAHDPDLDEAVIAFANADFELSEASLAALTRAGGPRADHAETWLVLFDLYRAIGEQPKFEALALQYASRFGLSSPQWFSMPALAAEAGAPVRASNPGAPPVGWSCPELLDVEAVDRLRAQAATLPMPWVFDWSGLQDIYAEASARLAELFRDWAPRPLEMRWIACERLLLVLQEAAPTGLRDVDPAYWQLRLETLRLVNRPDHFDEAAIDYCVTYEVSPPSWERPECRVKLIHSAVHSRSTSAPSTQDGASSPSTSFVESTQPDDGAASQVSRLQLSGELVGDISEMLAAMASQLGASTVVKIDCTRLIRVDFLAAGDLLNWVLTRRNENRVVELEEAHRLVASFFGAMGINEHARVKVRTV
jgi:ABC-type transporter Mla MlaB component